MNVLVTFFRLHGFCRRATPSAAKMARPALRPAYVSPKFMQSVVAVLVISIAGLSAAEEPLSESPAVYKGREIAVTMHYTGAPWLVRESRQREEDCQQLLQALGIKPGQVVCDMGCGNGFYSLKLAELVGPEGKVLAVDIQSEMLAMLRAEMRKANVENIRPLLGTPVDPRLEPESVDLVLMVDVYHEFSHPAEMLAAIRKSLKPRGRVALVEFREEDPLVPVKPLHKMSKRQIMKEFVANGYKLVGEYDQLPWQHLMFFERESNPESGQKHVED